MGKKCLFCGEANLSNEHFIAQWLLKELGIDKAHITMIRASFYGALKTKRHHHILRLVNGNVCSTCNKGWMSQLEVQIQPHIINLMNHSNLESEFDWLKLNSFTISKWVFKNAILYNNASDYYKLVPEKHFQSLKNGSIPSNVFITFGFCKQFEGVDLRQDTGILTLHHYDSEIPKLKSKGYNITIRIKGLLIKVRYYDGEKEVSYEDKDCFQIYPEFLSFGQTKSYMYDSIDEFMSSGIIHTYQTR